MKKNFFGKVIGTVAALIVSFTPFSACAAGTPSYAAVDGTTIVYNQNINLQDVQALQAQYAALPENIKKIYADYGIQVILEDSNGRSDLSNVYMAAGNTSASLYRRKNGTYRFGKATVEIYNNLAVQTANTYAYTKSFNHETGHVIDYVYTNKTGYEASMNSGFRQLITLYGPVISGINEAYRVATVGGHPAINDEYYEEYFAACVDLYLTAPDLLIKISPDLYSYVNAVVTTS